MHSLVFFHSNFPLSLYFSAMKLIKIASTIFNPRRLVSSKKHPSAVSRPEMPSSSAGTSSLNSSSSSISKLGAGTPNSVLPYFPGYWSEISAENSFEVARALKQMESLFHRLGADPPSQEEVKMILSEVDRTSDEGLTLEALMTPVGSAVCESELREAFDFFDKDNDGKITAEELLNVFSALGDDDCTLEDCGRMVAQVDKVGGGFVCFDDFVRMMAPQM